jgi:uncharacterized protein YegJ (DUF2314 family)
MRQFFYAIFLFFMLGISASLAFAAEGPDKRTQSDIRYQSVIYFYPDATPPTEKDLSQYLQDFTRVEALPETASKAVVSLSLLDDFTENYFVPDQEYLAYSGRGLSKEQVDAIQGVKKILVVDIAYPDVMVLSGYAPVMNFLHQIAVQHSGLVWDSETRELFEPKAWAETRLAPYERFPNITQHITIHAYNAGDENYESGIRAITLGMAKFGRPDVVINDFSWSLSRPMGNLINLTAQSIFEGNHLTEDNTLRLDINAIRNAELKQSLLKDLMENAETKIEIEIGEAKWEEGDPYNDIVEILFDKFEGAKLSEKQDKAVSALFGWEDTVQYVKHEDKVLHASQRAKAKLDGLRKAFNDGLNPGDYILLKAPFIREDGGNEWMWVEVMSWDKKSIKGLLKNEPYFVPGLRAGSEVQINQDDVFDYIREFSDGRSEGNETGQIMSQQR